MRVDAPTDLTTWLHLMPQLPVTDMDRSIADYQEALGFVSPGAPPTTAWPPWPAVRSRCCCWFPGPTTRPCRRSPPTCTSKIPTPCARSTGAPAPTFVDPVASRPYGMRDFVVRDPDGDRFTLGRGEQTPREVADHYRPPPPRRSLSTRRGCPVAAGRNRPQPRGLRRLGVGTRPSSPPGSTYTWPMTGWPPSTGGLPRQSTHSSWPIIAASVALTWRCDVS